MVNLCRIFFYLYGKKYTKCTNSHTGHRRYIWGWKTSNCKRCGAKITRHKSNLIDRVDSNRQIDNWIDDFVAICDWKTNLHFDCIKGIRSSYVCKSITLDDLPNWRKKSALRHTKIFNFRLWIELIVIGPMDNVTNA